MKIETGEVSHGQLPKKAGALVKEWCKKHRDELLNNWQRAQNFEALERIQGADYDD